MFHFPQLRARTRCVVCRLLSRSSRMRALQSTTDHPPLMGLRTHPPKSLRAHLVAPDKPAPRERAARAELVHIVLHQRGPQLQRIPPGAPGLSAVFPCLAATNGFLRASAGWRRVPDYVPEAHPQVRANRFLRDPPALVQGWCPEFWLLRFRYPPSDKPGPLQHSDDSLRRLAILTSGWPARLLQRLRPGCKLRQALK